MFITVTDSNLLIKVVKDFNASVSININNFYCTQDTNILSSNQLKFSLPNVKHYNN